MVQSKMAQINDDTTLPWILNWYVKSHDDQLIVILTVYELQKWVKFYKEKLGVVLTRAKNLLIVSNIN